jgi:nitrilase
LIAAAAAHGARLVAFGETWLPGYPRFVNATVPYNVKRQLGGIYLEASIYVPGEETARLCEAARTSNVDVVIGVAERDATTHGTTYCTLLFISSDGVLLGKHRKLKPTYGERTAWGEGDATGLRVHERPYANISGLNCWEHNMVLPGYVLMAGGTQVHVAAFPGHEPADGQRSSTRQLLLARTFASQAAAYVILVGGIIRPDDAPDPALRDAIATLPPMNGGSYIIDPHGEVIAGPARDEEILLADVSHTVIAQAKHQFDIGGHYSRPDIFQLKVNRQPVQRVIETAD